MPETDRASAESARVVVERLLPDVMLRLEVLRLVADLVEQVAARKPQSWGLTLQPAALSLNVSGWYAVGLKPSTLYVSVIRSQVLEALEAELQDVARWGEPFVRLPESGCLYLPLDRVSEFLPRLRPAITAFVDATLDKYSAMGGKVEGAHSPGLVAYLENFLEHGLPEPNYLAEQDETSEEEAPSLSLIDWQAELAAWLQDNPKTITPDQLALREGFAQQFPRDGLRDLTLDQYALGRNSHDTFCYWLEFRTNDLGSIRGGSAAKFGVWWSAEESGWRWNAAFSSAEDARSRITEGLTQVVEAAGREEYDQLAALSNQRLGPNRDTLPAKTLYLYFPDNFLPIFQRQHLAHFLELFGQIPAPDLYGRNRQLLTHLRALPEIDSLDTAQMMRFLYDTFPPPTAGFRIWKIAPGTQAAAWSGCRDRGCIAIGWLADTDYRTLPTQEDVVRALAAAGSERSAYTPIRQFTYEMKPGDIVVANKGRRTVVGIGRITSDYLPPDDPANVRPNHPDHPWLTQSRRVEWLVQKPIDFADFRLQIRTISSLDMTRWRQIKQAYFARYPNDPDLRDAFATLEDATLEQVVMVDPSPPPSPPVPKAVNALLVMAGRTRNILLYGPPGTGKTWLVTQFACAFTDSDKAEMVTFHQSFAYEEFVEGVKPDIHDGQLDYRVVDGVFKRICRTAEQNPDQRYLLIIDEINRANIAKVLGELITLIEDDKRVGEGQPNALRLTLPYSGDKFGVPKNLTILGTMNTADRSIALLDLALRRRFTFVEMPPDPSLLPTDVAGVNLRTLLERLNGRVSALLDRDHRIGHSYLMGLSDEGGLHFAWYRRIVPLLQEYFYGDGDRLKAVLGGDFMRAVTPDADTRAVLGGAYEEDARYEVQWLEGESFRTALRRLAGGVVTMEVEAETPEGG